MSDKPKQIIEPKEPPAPPTVDVGEIPLPPEELWPDLENAGGGETSEAKPADADVARLDFVDATKREKVIPIVHTFRWDGAVVTSVTVRRLVTDEVADLLARSAGGNVSRYEIYSQMTGLPASVLRGLDDEDGDAVTGACYDFLPRVFRPTESASSSA
ncbi:hypothetical protein [Amorphus sp. MBR-141]